MARIMEFYFLLGDLKENYFERSLDLKRGEGLIGSTNTVTLLLS